MDCKTESAARSAIRIEAIVLQGIAHGLFLFAVGVLTAPLVPCVFVFGRTRANFGKLTRVLCSPFFFAAGCLFALVNPFVVLLGNLKEVWDVAKVEWETRWMAGQPKKPNGHPLAIPTEDEMEAREMGFALGVIKDYNAEAREYGQGLPIDETAL